MGDIRIDSVNTLSDPGKEESDGNRKRYITKEHRMLPGFSRQLYATIAVCFAAFSSGNVLGWIGPMMLKLPVPHGPVDGVNTDTLNRLLTIMQLSSICNMMTCGFLMDIMGRRAGCWFLNLFAPAGWVFFAMARSPVDLFFGGLMVSATMAAGLVVGVVFVSEVSNEKLRSHFLTLIVFFHSCGVLFSHILGEFLSYKTFNLSCLAVSLLFPFVFHPLPETPSFLVLKSRLAEARTSLEWYQGNDKEAVDVEMLKLLNASEKLVTNRCKTMISSRGDVVSLAVITFMSIFAELCGTTVIETYAGVIIKDTIKRPDLASENALILAFVRFLAGLICVPFVEKTGRKIMLTLSLGVMACSLFTLSIILKCTAQDFDPTTNSHHPLPSGLIIFLICAVLGIYTVANQILLAVTEIVGCEIACPKKRGMFLAVGGTFKILTLVICLQMYYYLQNKAVYYNYVFAAVCCVVGILVVIYYIPETRGKSFKTIREEVDKKIGLNVEKTLSQHGNCSH